MSASVSSLLQSSGRQRIIEAVVAVLALGALWLLSFTPQWRQLEFKTFPDELPRFYFAKWK